MQSRLESRRDEDSTLRPRLSLRIEDFLHKLSACRIIQGMTAPVLEPQPEVSRRSFLTFCTVGAASLALGCTKESPEPDGAQVELRFGQARYLELHIPSMDIYLMGSSHLPPEEKGANRTPEYLLNRYRDILQVERHSYDRLTELAGSNRYDVGVEYSVEGIPRGIRDARAVYQAVREDYKQRGLPNAEGVAYDVVLLGLRAGITLHALSQPTLNLFPLEPLNEKLLSMRLVARSTELSKELQDMARGYPADYESSVRLIRYIAECQNNRRISDPIAIDQLIQGITSSALRAKSGEFATVTNEAMQSRIDADKWMAEAILRHRKANPGRGIIAEVGTGHAIPIRDYLIAAR